MSKYTITQGGFFCLAELDQQVTQIEIAGGLQVSFFDNIQRNIEIFVGENTKLEFFSLFDGEKFDSQHTHVAIHQPKDASQVYIRSLLISLGGKKVDTKILSHISSDTSKSDVKILSILGEKGDITLDGVIQIDQGSQQVEGYLEEENLFLGDSGKVKGIPTLLVESDDVKASHSCKMERVSDEKLFYLRSRGVGKQNAMDMMIESYISDLFSGLENINKDFFQQVFDEILTKLSS